MMTQPVVTNKKYLIFSLAVFSTVCLLSSRNSSPQDNVEPFGIMLDFRCPDLVFARPKSLTLMAEVVGARRILGQKLAERITYKWEISGGRILAGQGTRKVTIQPETGLKSVSLVRAKILLDGVPPEFNRESVCSLKLDSSCTTPTLFEQYGDIGSGQERQRLDRLGKYLNGKGAGLFTFVVVYEGHRTCFREAEFRTDRLRKYLTEKYKIPESQLITINGGFRDKFTVNIFTAKSDGCAPFPTPTLTLGNIKSTGFCKDKYKSASLL